MLSTSKLVLVVVPWQIISRNAVLPSLSLSHPPTRFCAPTSFVARSVRRISATFKGGLSCPAPSSSLSSFGSSSCCCSSVTFRKPGVGQQHQEQYRRKNSRRRQLVKNVLVDSGNRTCARIFKGGPLYCSSSAFSSTAFRCSSVMFRRLRAGQQQQQRRRRNSNRRHQMSSITVEAIASPDSLTANLNQKPLYDELQRYGVDESDYDCTAINLGRQQPNFSLDLEKHKTTSSKLRKRKATAELTSGSQEQLPTLKDESGVVEDWCAYLLLSGDLKKTYVGVTYDIRRRLRQHNGEIAGGAKSARAGRPWRLVCTVRGFNNRSEACQFEWTWKSTAAKIKTIRQVDSKMMESPLVTRRRATLAKVLKAKEEWSYLNVQWHAD